MGVPRGLGIDDSYSRRYDRLFQKEKMALKGDSYAEINWNLD